MRELWVTDKFSGATRAAADEYASRNVAECHRLKSRIGPAQALIATAHKLARVVYKMLKDKVPYGHTTAQEEEERLRDCEIAYLKHKAAKLGLILADTEGTIVSQQPMLAAGYTAIISL